MSPGAPVFGNAGQAGRETRGWFLGHFVVDAASPLHSEEVELKWFVHAEGEARSEWAPPCPVRTLNLLVRG